jgi:hypothetical protein
MHIAGLILRSNTMSNTSWGTLEILQTARCRAAARSGTSGIDRQSDTVLRLAKAVHVVLRGVSLQG